MEDKLAARFDIYDALCDAYSKLNNLEKEDFDKGLTMLYDNQYFAKHKKSNVNHKAKLITEIFNLSALAINLSNQISGIGKFDKLTNFSITEEFNTVYE